MTTPRPIMHPIDMLPTISAMIDGQVLSDAPLLNNLRRALHTPGTLDAPTVLRAKRAYQERLTYIPVFRQQITHWSADAANAHLTPEFDRLGAQVSTLEATAREILGIARFVNLLTDREVDIAALVLLGCTDPTVIGEPFHLGRQMVLNILKDICARCDLYYPEGRGDRWWPTLRTSLGHLGIDDDALAMRRRTFAHVLKETV
jgi:hypothetical protein